VFVCSEKNSKRGNGVKQEKASVILTIKGASHSTDGKKVLLIIIIIMKTWKD
jgi:hypothetical protein